MGESEKEAEGPECSKGWSGKGAVFLQFYGMCPKGLSEKRSGVGKKKHNEPRPGKSGRKKQRTPITP